MSNTYEVEQPANKVAIIALADCFHGTNGETALAFLRREVARPWARPREGMTMQETAVYELGRQSVLYMIEKNIDNGRKAKAHA